MYYGYGYSGPSYPTVAIPRHDTVSTLEVGNSFQLANNQPVFTVVGKSSIRETVILAVLPKKKGRHPGDREYRILHLSADRLIMNRANTGVAADFRPIDLSDQTAKVSVPTYTAPSRGKCWRCGRGLDQWGDCTNPNCRSSSRW